MLHHKSRRWHTFTHNAIDAQALRTSFVALLESFLACWNCDSTVFDTNDGSLGKTDSCLLIAAHPDPKAICSYLTGRNILDAKTTAFLDDVRKLEVLLRWFCLKKLESIENERGITRASKLFKKTLTLPAAPLKTLQCWTISTCFSRLFEQEKRYRFSRLHSLKCLTYFINCVQGPEFFDSDSDSDFVYFFRSDSDSDGFIMGINLYLWAFAEEIL